MNACVCITTVRSPTAAVRAFVSRFEGDEGGCVVVAGDKKGPASYPLNGAIFMGLDSQLSGPFELARKLPTGHYCRKNIAYLEGIRRGASLIFETDDDNIPLNSWRVRGERLQPCRLVSSPSLESMTGSRWVNVYRYFTDEFIWPRGLPLDEIRAVVPLATVAVDGERSGIRAPVQQGLVNGSPDVDAIWRLTLDRPFEFEPQQAICLQPGNWCPFNSQNTWWWPVAYPLMYIPSYCTFRMCDIWRSFVAQRCLWAAGFGVEFHDADVVQERNPHDLMRDFHDEIPGYERNREFAELLQALDLAEECEAIPHNLRRCYETLVCANFFPEEELTLLDAWLADIESVVAVRR